MITNGRIFPKGALHLGLSVKGQQQGRQRKDKVHRIPKEHGTHHLFQTLGKKDNFHNYTTDSIFRRRYAEEQKHDQTGHYLRGDLCPSYRGENAPRTPGCFHGTAFSSLYNGYDEAKAKQWQWTFAAARKRLEGARVVKIWDPDRALGRAAGRRLRHPRGLRHPGRVRRRAWTRCSSWTTAPASSGSMRSYPLRQGVPDLLRQAAGHDRHAAAKEIARLVRETGTPFMSASSLRFVPDIVALKTAAAVAGRHPPGHDDLRQRAGLLRHPRPVDVLWRFWRRRDLVPQRRPAGPQHRARALRERPRPGADGGREGVYARRLPDQPLWHQGWRSVVPDLADLYWYLQEQFISLLPDRARSLCRWRRRWRSSPCWRRANARWPRGGR